MKPLKKAPIGAGREEMDKNDVYWIGYMYSYMRGMDEEERKMFMRRLLYRNVDVEVNWSIYSYVFEKMLEQIRGILNQAGMYQVGKPYQETDEGPRSET